LQQAYSQTRLAMAANLLGDPEGAITVIGHVSGDDDVESPSDASSATEAARGPLAVLGIATHVQVAMERTGFVHRLNSTSWARTSRASC
jgi:hypothetical protein